jgi:hypothetical protein
MNFLYVALLTPRLLRRLHSFWRRGGQQPYCVHGIHPFRRIWGGRVETYSIVWFLLINYSAQNIQTRLISLIVEG